MAQQKYEIGPPGSGSFVNYARQRYPNIPTEEALQQLLLEQQLAGGEGIDLPPVGGGGGTEQIIPMGPEDGAPIAMDFQMPPALPWESDFMPQISVPDATGGSAEMPFADLSSVVPQGQMPDFAPPGFTQDIPPGGSDFFNSIMQPPDASFQMAPSDLGFTGTPAPAWAEPTPIPGPGGITATGFEGMFPDTGSINVGGDVMGFSTNPVPDWWESLGSLDSLWTMPDYGQSLTANVGGNDISSFGSSPDFGYVPPASDALLGFGGTDTGGASWDFTGTPAPSFTEPAALPGTEVPAPTGDVTVETPTDTSPPPEMPPLVAPPPIPDVPADQSPVTPDGTALPDPFAGNIIGYDVNGEPIYGGTPVSPAPVQAPVFSGGVGPSFDGGLGLSVLSPLFSGGVNSVSIGGVPGTFVITPSGDIYSTHIGMFGLGAMNAPGGYMPVGFGGRESNIGGAVPDTLGDLGVVADRNAMKQEVHGWGPNYDPNLAGGGGGHGLSAASADWLTHYNQYGHHNAYAALAGLGVPAPVQSVHHGGIGK